MTSSTCCRWTRTRHACSGSTSHWLDSILLCAVLLTAVVVAGIGVIGFVGLIAPHAARTLVGRRHTWALPVAAALGATLVILADTLGRTVIAPSQLPAGLPTAVIGGPYFFWLLYRSRVRTS